MAPEILDERSGVNASGDVVPFDDTFNDEVVRASQQVMARKLGSHAAQSLPSANENQSQESRNLFVRTVETVIKERQMNVDDNGQDDEREDPYASLGGGLGSRLKALEHQKRLPLEAYLQLPYKPWHRDIRRAVEQFGAAEITPRQLYQMSKDELDLYSKYFYGYQATVINSFRLLTQQGSVADPIVIDRYGLHTQDELNAYARHLKVLLEDLKQTGIPALAEGRLPSTMRDVSVLARWIETDRRKHSNQVPFVCQQGDKLRLVRAHPINKDTPA